MKMQGTSRAILSALGGALWLCSSDNVEYQDQPSDSQITSKGLILTYLLGHSITDSIVSIVGNTKSVQ